jgi:galactitol PTS system EIIA component
MIDSKYIIKDLDVSNQKELFETIGQALMEDKIVKDGFIEALLKREKEYPTGLPVNPGVAIPHTDGTLVNEDRLVFATLKNPVTFAEMGGSDENTIDIHIVILMAIKDGKKHLETLRQLIDSIKKEEFIKGLFNSKNSDEMETIIKKFL